MAGAYKPILWTIIVLGFCAWVVALAGISEVTNDCYVSYWGNGFYDTRSAPGVLTYLGMNCVRGLQFQWWGVWFEFIVLVMIAAFAATKNLPAHQATLTGLLATVTAINMMNARIFMQTVSSNFVYEVSNRQSGLNVAAAGYVMFCTFNLMLVLLLGSGLVWFKEQGHDQHVVGYGNKGAAAASGPGPNFAQPATFASPLSGGGARAYLPGGTNTGEVTISH